ncbi:MAG: recombinase family protein [Verrucomicrobiales bacterium]|nr:recombinase family protein [Verrucomicrobiales bacterium]
MTPTDSSSASVAVLYGRVSTNFVRQGNSIALQDDRLRAYCDFKGIAVAEVFHEDVSGTIPFLERPLGAKAWRDWLGCGRAHHLILTCIDRLGRNAADMLGFFDRCQKEGVSVHLVDQGAAIDFTDPSGRLFVQIMALFAENERLRIVGRINANLKRLREEGFAVGKAPYGWRHVGTGVFRERAGGRVEQKRVEEDPDEQACLRWMVDLRVQGHGYQSIARQLNAAGFEPKIKAGSIIVTARAKPELGQEARTAVATGRWTPSGVESVLTNRYTREKFPELQGHHAN